MGRPDITIGKSVPKILVPKFSDTILLYCNHTIVFSLNIIIVSETLILSYVTYSIRSICVVPSVNDLITVAVKCYGKLLYIYFYCYL